MLYRIRIISIKRIFVSKITIPISFPLSNLGVIRTVPSCIILLSHLAPTEFSIPLFWKYVRPLVRNLVMII